MHRLHGEGENTSKDVGFLGLETKMLRVQNLQVSLENVCRVVSLRSACQEFTVIPLLFMNNMLINDWIT